MAQVAGVGGREGIRGADTARDDEFGAMESPDGAWEGQVMSPPVVRALDASLQAAQFTTEQRVLMEAELQRHLAPMWQQNLEFQASNHALTMELTALHALDQGPRDLFPRGASQRQGTGGKSTQHQTTATTTTRQLRIQHSGRGQQRSS